MNTLSEQPVGPGAREGSRGLWVLLTGLMVALCFTGWHAGAVTRYLDRVTETRFESSASAAPLQRIPQSIAPDGQMWIRHTLAMAERGEWRLRTSQVDNAPDGRAIYWNSGWAWWLRACARARMWFTGEPFPTALERSSAWANLPVLWSAMALLSFWTWRRFGGAAGACVALAMAGHRGFYEGFYPAYCDHHGLIAASVLGLTMSVTFAGAGWRRKNAGMGSPWLPGSEQAVMRAMSVSAVCGALGLWVSAASVVVTIAFIGLAALAAGLSVRSQEVVAVPAAWKRWGRLGAACSLGFYLLENFPDRLGLRLEANHPLYSLAWCGAGEMLADFFSWRTGGLERREFVKRWLRWLPAVLAAPVAVLVGGPRVFAPAGPFLARVHEAIHEFQPVWVAIDRSGWRSFGDQLFIPAVLVLASLVWLWRNRSKSDDFRSVLTWAMCVAAMATLLGCWQSRWLGTASGPQIVLSLLLAAAMTSRLSPRWRAAGVLLFALLLFGTGPWKLASERLLVERVRDVQKGEALQLLYREVAGFLRATGADDQSIVLADPNASVGVGYYGRFKTVGTLYWENAAGLEAAAAILNAKDAAEAAALVYARGVTHIVFVFPYDFLNEYSYAFHGEKTRADAGFGRSVFNENQVPVWLRPLDYKVPSALNPLGFRVSVFAVDFAAPPAEAHERIGLYQLSRGDKAAAETSFMSAMAADPARAQPWLMQGYVLLSEGKTAEAFSFIRAGIDRAPAESRDEWIRTSAMAFARQGAMKESQVLLGLLK